MGLNRRRFALRCDCIPLALLAEPTAATARKGAPQPCFNFSAISSAG